jgi:predicted dehydrogenase
MTRALNRRKFLQHTSAAVGFWVATRESRSESRSPNERLRVAAIGVGGKGKTDVSSVAEAGAEIVALCDVDDERAKDSYAAFPQARRFADYREMFDKMHGQIDAVIVSTPDHMHAGPTMVAMKLGKHVYTQKPLTHTVHEARLLAETARQQKVVSQMGNQGTALDSLREAIEVIRAGHIGSVKEVHVWTNRPIWPQGASALIEHAAVKPALHGRTNYAKVPSTLQWDLWLGCAPERPYDPIYVPFKWRGWMDFGTGALGDMACHLMNMPYQALKLGYPTAVEAQAAPDLTEETYPSWSVVNYEFPARGEQPPVRMTWYDGGRNRPEWATRRLTELCGMKNLPGSGYVCVGEKGNLLSPSEIGGQYRLVPQERFAGHKPPPRTLPRVIGHYKEWIQACIENKLDMPMSSFDVAGPLTETVLLGCLAMRVGGRIEWDPAAMRITDVVSEKKTSVAEANKYLTKEYRKGWEL